MSQENYPHYYPTTNSIHTIISTYKDIDNGTHLHDKIESVIGRIMLARPSSKKLVFYTLAIDGKNIQIMSNISSYKSEDDFYSIHCVLKRGDIIGVTGFIAKTKVGELSIIPSDITLLTPCMTVIPSSHYGIEDKEIRYSNRPLDMIVNPLVQPIFRKRSKMIHYIRNYLYDREFLEVETPMMSGLAGGASAKPFTTYHNEMKMSIFLRIAPELYLKQCIIGGMAKVFEIGKQFRNEGIDSTHNPEFTSIELYEVGADYNSLMVMTQDLLRKIAIEVNGTTIVTWKEHTIDLYQPFTSWDVMDKLEELLRVELGETFTLPSLDSPNLESEYKMLIDKVSLKMTPPYTINRMMDKLIGHYVEPLCIQPTFLINHPQIMSPLAKSHRSLPNKTERFELFIGSMEYVNSYTELNDPIKQKNIFEEVQKQKTNGDDEIPPSDDKFITALEIGLPPTGGWGMGIDRLCMLLTGNDSIREVILFPTQRFIK